MSYFGINQKDDEDIEGLSISGKCFKIRVYIEVKLYKKSDILNHMPTLPKIGSFPWIDKKWPVDGGLFSYGLSTGHGGYISGPIVPAVTPVDSKKITLYAHGNCCGEDERLTWHSSPTRIADGIQRPGEGGNGEVDPEARGAITGEYDESQRSRDLGQPNPPGW
jgi:hypothetical protein